MKKIFVLLTLTILLSACGKPNQEVRTQEVKNGLLEETTKNAIAKNNNIKEQKYKEEETKKQEIKEQKEKKVKSKQEMLRTIKNVKAVGDFEMMRYDCDKFRKNSDVYQECIKEKEEAKKRYWKKIKQRNQKIASFSLKDCEVSVGKKYKKQLEQIGKVPPRELLFNLPPNKNLTPDKLNKLSKEEVKNLIYKQMQQEINQCKLGFAFQKNICDKLKDEKLKQECKKLRTFWEMKTKLEQIERFDVKDYLNY